MDNTEEIEVDIETNESGDPVEQDDAEAGQSGELELSDDPEQLKATAKQQTRRVRELEKSNKLLESRVTEESAKAVYRQERINELERNVATKPPEPKPQAKKPAFDAKSVMTKEEWNDILTEDKPDRFIEIVASRVVEPMVNARFAETSEASAAENAVLRDLVAQYPDLAKPDSPHLAETTRRFEEIERAMPGIAREAAYRMAAAEAAALLGVKPQARNNGRVNVNGERTDGTRLQTAQAAPASRRQAGGESPAKADPVMERFATKHGVPPDVARKIIADTAKRNQKRA